MRIGPSHQAGSDSLLTASTFFKMREIYFSDKIDDAEYNGKLYGLGQTFALTNGTEPVRGSAATLAEREDRGPQRELSQTPGPTQSHSVPMALATPAMASAMPAQIPPSTPYGPMGANGPYMRPAIGVVGGR